MYHYVTWMYHTFVPLHLATLHLLHCIWSPCICHIALVILYLAHWICKFESHERPLNTSWRLKNVSWSPSDCIINFPPISFLYDLNVTWKYHECHLNVLQMSPECECAQNFTLSNFSERSWTNSRVKLNFDKLSFRWHFLIKSFDYDLWKVS